MKKQFLRLVIMIVVLLSASAAGFSGPIADGGAFPTSTPTETQPPPTHPPTNTPQLTPVPTGTNTQTSGDALDRLPAFDISSTATPIPTPIPEESQSNPLLPVFYIGLFIFLVVGVWMLFSRRGMGP